MLAERGVNVDHTTIYRGSSAMPLKWKNACAGIGVIPPTCALGIWMKPTSKSVVNGLICTVQLTATVGLSIFIFPLGVIPKQLIDS
ncbi:transposase [Yersinia frederiksenii ATCC 33641]|nr:transposase [Yersinia frederiksenii ATCC 33641]